MRRPAHRSRVVANLGVQGIQEFDAHDPRCQNWRGGIRPRFDRLGSTDIIRTSSVGYQMASSPSSLNTADRVGSSVLDLIGRTPLVRLHRIEVETPGVELWAKAEWQNPGGSVKDRAAARMILEGEASGAQLPERRFWTRFPETPHCLRDGWGGARVSCQGLPSGERKPGAKDDSEGARGRAGFDRSS